MIHPQELMNEAEKDPESISVKELYTRLGLETDCEEKVPKGLVKIIQDQTLEAQKKLTDTYTNNISNPPKVPIPFKVQLSALWEDVKYSIGLIPHVMMCQPVQVRMPSSYLDEVHEEVIKDGINSLYQKDREEIKGDVAGTIIDFYLTMRNPLNKTLDNEQL